MLDDVNPPLGGPPKVGALIADAAKRLSRRAAANAVELEPATPMGIRLRAWSLRAEPAPPEPEGLATERDRVLVDLAVPSAAVTPMSARRRRRFSRGRRTSSR